MFIDSHAHLAEAEFQSDLPSVLDRARSARVERVLVIGDGVDPAKTAKAVLLGEREGDLDVAAGIHPHEASLASESSLDNLVRLARSGRLVAWGEIGLDFHYSHSPPEEQEEVFSRQLALAREVGLPVVIHTREAEARTLEILGDHYANGGSAGVMHCFSGSLAMVRACLEMGFHISFSGMVTFPKAHDLRQVARAVPMDRLLIETDAPYLAPVPFRGRRNEPAHVVETQSTGAGQAGRPGYLGQVYDGELSSVVPPGSRDAAMTGRIPGSGPIKVCPNR
ncbi:MAG: TatD family hydrolase, partial [Acidobacteriota bacterium]|nr:TatD family hydrolase [Acidobacteriota bacterium]